MGDVVHGPTEPVKTRYPGGKDGWYTVHCVAEDCTYHATSATAQGAEKQVRQHARDLNARLTS